MNALGPVGALLVVAGTVAMARGLHRRRVQVAVGRPGFGRRPGDVTGALAGWLAGALPGADARGVLRTWSLTTTAAVLIAGLQSGFVAAAVVAVSVPAVSLASLWMFRDRRAKMIRRGIPVLLEEIARSLRAGVALGPAVVSGSTCTPEIERELLPLVSALKRGDALDSAIGRMRSHAPGRACHGLLAALSLAARAGGRRARALDAMAASLREEDRIAGEIRAQTAQARASALVLFAAPILFMALSSSIDASVQRFLFGTVTGGTCVAVGFLLDLAGGAWMYRMVHRTSDHA